MVPTRNPMLTVDLRGPDWRARLDIEPPRDTGPRDAVFEVPALGSRHGPLRRITAAVRYTIGIDRLGAAWPVWHVKVYRCGSIGDADALRAYLHRQAADIQRANADLAGRSGLGIEPPWAVTPVQIIRGDGRSDLLDGGIRTELAISPRRVVDQMANALPAWFGDESANPESHLLAVSPQLDRVDWPAYRNRPGTEQLADFVDMAAGLDTLHRHGTVHCDIKPDNVCRYSTPTAKGYALIDTDAVTRVDPPPTTLRVSPPYDYLGLREWTANEGRQGYGIDQGVLRAQDRHGFALIVLTALAGRDWVRQALLGGDEDTGTRPADDRDQVVAAFRRHWPDTDDRCWAPLIDALAEPFGTAIESARWSASGWIHQLRIAEEACVRPVTTPRRLPLRPGPVSRYGADLDLVRRQAGPGPASRPQQVRHAYESLQRRALAVGTRQAVHAALRWTVALTGVALMLAVGALGLGK